MRGGQYGSYGSVCAFPQKVQKFVDTLPNDPRDLKVKVIKKCKHINKKFYIRHSKIKAALEFLQQHNQMYKKIKINKYVMDNIKENDNLEDYMERMETKDPRETICQIIEKIPKLPNLTTSIYNKLKKMGKWKNTESTEINLKFTSESTIETKNRFGRKV